MKGITGITGLLVAVLFFSAGVKADKNIYTGWFSNKAVSGYDTVAYFTERKPVKGSPDFRYKYLGVEWHFSSKKNLETFKANPKKYRPQYGGYCAWAVGEKKKRAPGDPNYWSIIDGKLYLNYNEDINDKWRDKVEVFIKKADENWPKMMSK